MPERTSPSPDTRSEVRGLRQSRLMLPKCVSRTHPKRRSGGCEGLGLKLGCLHKMNTAVPTTQ
eukprot:scaffold51129_cov19-Tisochrysis_lutea.AAC.1